MKRLMHVLLAVMIVFTRCAVKLPEIDKDICNNFKFDEKTIKFREESTKNGNFTDIPLE